MIKIVKTFIDLDFKLIIPITGIGSFVN